MIFHRLSVLRFLTRGNDRAAAEMARRWRRAFRECPELAEDLIRLGGLLALPPERIADGTVAPDPIDPYRVLQERGERALAIKLLALGGLTPTEFNDLMETQDV